MSLLRAISHALLIALLTACPSTAVTPCQAEINTCMDRCEPAGATGDPAENAAFGDNDSRSACEVMCERRCP